MIAAVLAIAALAIAKPAHAGERLKWSGAVEQVEGAAGGGLVPWALIGGLGTNVEVGATAFVTYLSTRDFALRSVGAGVDVDKRVEISAARQRCNAGSVIRGLMLGQDILGIKVRVAGDAVFDADTWLPQIALGAQWKRTLDFEQAPRSLGAAHGAGVDWYVAATKVYFAALAGHNVVMDVTLRRTSAPRHRRRHAGRVLVAQPRQKEWDRMSFGSWSSMGNTSFFLSLPRSSSVYRIARRNLIDR